MINFTSKDVYDAIPTIVTTFVALVAKISIFIFFLELVIIQKKLKLLSPEQIVYLLVVYFL